MKNILLFSFLAIPLLIPSLSYGLEVAGFTFNPPSEWVSSKPTSNMRKAQFEAQSKSKEKVEIAFFHFGSTGAGGIQANVDRWFTKLPWRKFQVLKIGNF